MNIHLHSLVLDGVYCASAEGAPVFRPAPALTNEKLQALLDDENERASVLDEIGLGPVNS